MFTTPDSDNDERDEASGREGNCAVNRGGTGWWYNNCSSSDLHMNMVANGYRGRWVSNDGAQTQATRDVVESHMLLKFN